MTIRRRKDQLAVDQLAAAIAGVPAKGYTDEVRALAAYARLLAPKDLTGPAAREAGRAAFLCEAVVAAAHPVDLTATTDADTVDPIHTCEVVLEGGAVLRVADVEHVTEQDARDVGARIVASRKDSVRR